MRCVHARELLREPASHRLHARRYPPRQGSTPQCIRLQGRRHSRPAVHALAGAKMKTFARSVIVVAATAIPAIVQAQATDAELATLRLLGVPNTALPPVSLPMPASRNHNYYIGRFQTGYRKGPSGNAMP